MLFVNSAAQVKNRLNCKIMVFEMSAPGGIVSQWLSAPEISKLNEYGKPVIRGLVERPLVEPKIPHLMKLDEFHSVRNARNTSF